MKFKIKDRAPFVNISFALLALCLLLFIPKDPDFFWHLKYGEMTVQQGPISHDPFSYTFSDYIFYDYQWLSHVFIYFINEVGGYFLLAFGYAFIVFLSIFFSIKNPIVKRTPMLAKILVFFLSLVTVSPLIGIRPQMISVLGLSITFFILSMYLNKRSRLIYLLPIVTLVWVNSHPGFLSGIVLQVVFLIVEAIKYFLAKWNIKNMYSSFYTSQPSLLPLLNALFLSLISTIITPFGPHILLQSIKFAFDPYAGRHILEWLAPQFKNLSGVFALTYLISVIIILALKKKRDILLVSTLFLFGYMTLSAIRHLPLLVVTTIPLIANLKEWKLLKYLEYESLFLKFVRVVFFLSSIYIFTYNFSLFVKLNSNKPLLYKSSKFPYEAVNYLKEITFSGNIFNEYGWGGFLINEYPQKKVFIDGRMTSWELKGEKILETYVNLYNLEKNNWYKYLKKYNITLIITEPDSSVANAVSQLGNWSIVYTDKECVIVKEDHNFKEDL